MRGAISHKFLLAIMFSLVFIVFVPAPPAAVACSCVEPGTVEDELARSEAAFAGNVLEVKQHKSLNGYMTKSILFEVSESWKGVDESQVIIRTGQGGGDCGYNFQEGIDYLVYANSSSMYGDGEDLVSIICSRTTTLANAQEDLAILGQGDAPQKHVNLEGELDGMNVYVWALAIVLLGIIGFWIRRRFMVSKKR